MDVKLLARLERTRKAFPLQEGWRVVLQGLCHPEEGLLAYTFDQGGVEYGVVTYLDDDGGRFRQHGRFRQLRWPLANMLPNPDDRLTFLGMVDVAMAQGVYEVFGWREDGTGFALGTFYFPEYWYNHRDRTLRCFLDAVVLHLADRTDSADEALRRAGDLP